MDTNAEQAVPTVPEKEKLDALNAYIEANYVAPPPFYESLIKERYASRRSMSIASIEIPVVCRLRRECFGDAASEAETQEALDIPLPTPQPGFPTALLAALEKKGISNAECYTRANIDRKHFSKILCQPNYHPRKPVAIALILSLDPTPEEMTSLLETLGYCLSHSDLFDLVIEWCVQNGICRVDDVNLFLDSKGLPLLGSI